MLISSRLHEMTWGTSAKPTHPTTRVLTNLITAIVLLASASCYEMATTESEPESNLMGPEGGRIEAAQGRVTLEFPPDAVSEPISIEVAAASGVPSDPGVVPGTVYEFGPPGASFAAPVQLTIRYDPADLPAGVSEATLGLAHLGTGTWGDVTGSNLDAGEQTVTAFIDGFSVYGVRGQPAGSIELQVTTTGTNPDPDGYAIEIDGQPGESVDANDSATISEVPIGDRSVRLTGVASNCLVSGDNPRTVAVTPGNTAPVDFEVTCTDVTGDLEVSVATTGEDIDPDGYTATVDGQQQQAVGTNGTITFQGLAEGEHSLLLEDVASNCTVGGANPRTISVPGGGSASNTFEVDCTANSDGLIQNLSPTHYDTARLSEGDQYYIDRTFVIESLPADLEGGLWIRTANEDKNSSEEDFITFDLLEDAVIVVGYDPRASSLPNWLQDWQASSDGIGVSDDAASPLDVFHKPHSSGPVTLGGNMADGAEGAKSMYAVFILADMEVATGDISVTASTTGEELDPDGYTVTVDDQLSESIDVNGTVSFSELAEGDHSVELAGIAANCTLSGGNPRTVNVPADGTVSTTFEVSCTTGGGGGDATIIDVSFDWSTHRREAGGSDNWPTTWSNDDHQYSSWGDGGGFGGTNSDGRVSLGFARIEGGHDGYVGINRWGDTSEGSAECSSQFGGKAYGILSVNGIIYAWRSPASNTSGYEEFALIKSTDKGCTWSSPNSSPVVWTGADHNLVHGAFLNFGRDYAGARDGYVYTYAADIKNTSSLAIQAPGHIYLIRVPINDIENQAAYEFFTGTSAAPSWGSFSNRVPVFEDPSGVSWTTGSVIHVPGLDRYVLITEHTETMKGNIQIHEAPEPWGPWTEILRESNWGQVEASTFYWTFAPKWFRNGGLDFTLVFTGINQNDSWNTIGGSFTISSP